MVNSSSSGDSSGSPSLPLNIHCLVSRPSSFIFTIFIISTVLVLVPLSVFILHHGLQQRRQKRSSSSAAAVSHSDCFTYHMVVIELLGIFGWIICCFGIYLENFDTLFWGFIPATLTYYGQTFIHVLTCAEHYLGVVHPITYRNLRNERGTRIRNFILICVWLFSFTCTIIVMMEIVFILDICVLTLSTIFVFFCTLSVLCALNRPGPGEHGDRERVDQSKQRAFYTVVAIMAVMVLRFAGSVIWAVMFTSETIRSNVCLIMALTSWFNLPSSLVLPLLYLHRAGKLACRKNNVQ